MKKYYFFIYFFIFVFSFNNNLKSEIKNKIIVKVDKKIITSFEVKNKILSTLIIAGNEITQENINKLKGRTLENLILFKLKEIELERFDFKISNQRINTVINNFSKNNTQELKNKFNINGLDFNLWVKEVETELKWQQFIYYKYSNKIEIDKNIIEAEVKKILKSNIGYKEVNLSEIEVFQSDQVPNEQLIAEINDEIKNNGFENTALKFSVSNSSAEKGSIGWINSNALSKKINDAIKDLNPGQISKPILQTNSILILKLNSKRFVQNNNINKKKLTENLIKQKQNELFNLYSNSHLSKLKNNNLIEYK